MRRVALEDALEKFRYRIEWGRFSGQGIPKGGARVHCP
jgi:hypothetical protein